MEIKEKILKTALKLFIEIGFFEVSINDLIEEADITKNDFYDCFKSKEQLIYETIEKCFYSMFEDITKGSNEYNGSSKERLKSIFQRYSEMESYLRNEFFINKFNYESIICLTIKGEENYELMSKYIADFNKKLLKEIEYIIEEGKRLGEILGTINSKSTALNIFTSLHNSIVLWAMNQNIDIRKLFETDFKYLWNSIKAF